MATEEKKVIEKHPIYHDWYFSTDKVVKFRRVKGIQVPVEVERHERCRHCPTLGKTLIHIPTWTKGPRRYKYAPGVKINRVQKSVYLMETFLRTTDLDRDTVHALRSRNGSR